jgi:hypothetical protein
MEGRQSRREIEAILHAISEGRSETNPNLKRQKSKPMSPVF